jgi:steroid 5-alpha reductase family enzyme
MTTILKNIRSHISLLFHLFEPGSNLYSIEIIPVYGLAFWFYIVKQAATLQVQVQVQVIDQQHQQDVGVAAFENWGTSLFNLAVTNAIIQFILFIIVVQIPAYVTGCMSNVDIAWPTGLVLLAIQALYYARDNNNNNNNNDDGRFHYRTYLIGIALFIHGARMSLGAFVNFFPFNWPNGDLSRYQYAKSRWCRSDSSSSMTSTKTSTKTATSSTKNNLWWLKQQHETIMQAYANSTYLAAPILLVASNPNPSSLRHMEIIGFMCWIIFWCLENLSDIQKIIFVREAKKNNDIRTAVLGYTPYDTSQYWLWTKCRHPNYFFEWMCWNSFILMAIPSALDLLNVAVAPITITTTTTSTYCYYYYCLIASKVGIFFILFYTSRIFYDCLLYWTGAEPAESRSVVRRPLFKRYQEKTNVFFPFSVPFFFNHHRTPGWPITTTTRTAKD